MKSYKYHYFYKITNLITEEYYYGIHTTNNLDDGYMGSGHKLYEAKKKYGRKNFKKDIIKFFDTREECANYEKQIVTRDVVKDPKCYNSIIGGEPGNTSGMVAVKDASGNFFIIDKEDERYLNGIYVSNMKGLVHVITNDGNHMTISSEEYKNNKDKYLSYTTDTVAVIDKNYKKIRVSYDDYKKLKDNNEIIGGMTAGYGVYKDKNGDSVFCKVDDENVLNGNYVGYTKGLTIYKYKNDFSKTCYTTKDDPRVKNGELVGINYGIVHCINPITEEKISVRKDDPRLKTGELITMLKWANSKKQSNCKNTHLEHNADYYKQEYPELSKMILDGSTNTEILNNTHYTNSKFITKLRNILLKN